MHFRMLRNPASASNYSLTTRSSCHVNNWLNRSFVHSFVHFGGFPTNRKAHVFYSVWPVCQCLIDYEQCMMNRFCDNFPYKVVSMYTWTKCMMYDLQCAFKLFFFFKLPLVDRLSNRSHRFWYAIQSFFQNPRGYTHEGISSIVSLEYSCLKQDILLSMSLIHCICSASGEMKDSNRVKNYVMKILWIVL